jgi:hypothetical protein
MLVSHDPEFVFIQIPRTACRSMEAYLTAASKDSTQYKRHRTAKPEGTENYRCFATVRNPYSRMYSQYMWDKTARSADMHGWIKRENWTFAKYVDWATSPKAHPVKHHDKPQHHYVEGNVLRILYFEKLESDFASLLQLLQITPNGELPRLAKAPGTANWKSAYNAQIAAKVTEWALDDFKLLGYDENSWRK